MEFKTQCSKFPSSIKPYVDRVTTKQGYINYSVVVRHVNTGGANYLATIYEVDIKDNTHDGEKETNLFIKTIINSDKVNGFLIVSKAYLHESYFYNELSKIFIKLQDEANVPAEERFNSVKDYDVSDSEAIVLENAVKQGYTTYDRMKTTSLKLAELSIAQLARYHGLSFVIKKKMPEYFEKNIANMKMAVKYNELWAETAMVYSEQAIRNLESNLKKKLEERLPKLIADYQKLMATDTDTTICCLCHGDYKSSNTLIKEVDGQVIEVVPVDYQLIHYGCPVDDFILYIYTSTDKAFRTQHLDHLKELYHETMKKFLKFFALDIEEVYPRKEFENTLEDRPEVVLILSLFFFPLIFGNIETVPDLEKDDLRDTNIVLDLAAEKRLFEIIDEFIV